MCKTSQNWWILYAPPSRGRPRARQPSCWCRRPRSCAGSLALALSVLGAGCGEPTTPTERLRAAFPEQVRDWLSTIRDTEAEPAADLRERLVSIFLRGEDGWTLVDTGLGVDDPEAHWAPALAALFATPIPSTSFRLLRATFVRVPSTSNTREEVW